MEFDFLGLPALILCPLLLLTLVILRRRGCGWPFLACLAVFFVYLMAVAARTLFPITIDPEMARVLSEEGVTYFNRANLIPFWFGPYATAESISLAMGQNILLTMPFGFGINFVARTRKWHFIWLPALVGLSIEGLQLVISLLLGYPYRVIDVNDLIANAAGVLLGYAFFRVFRWAFLELARGARFKPGGWLAYLLEVASRS